MFALRALGWLFGLLGLLLVGISGLSFAVFPDPPLALKVVGGVGAAMMAGWLFLDWGSLRNLGSDQTVLRSTTASFAALLALGIAVTANVVVYRYDKQWDLTETKRYTLAPQSVDIAKQLDREIEVIAFFRSGMPDEANFKELMRRYQEHTSLLQVEYYDPWANPTMAEQNEVRTESPVVILKVGDNTQRLETSLDEQAFTSALVRVKSDVQHSVCVVTGHGELELMDDQSPDGIGIAKQKLEGVNYKVEPVSLLESQPTPESCEVLILASPQVDLLPAERDRLAQYVAAGGGLIVTVDPMVASETAADLSRYGVKVGNDLVIEADPYRQTQGGPTYVMLDDSSFDVHPITAKLKGGGLFGNVRSVGQGAEIPGLTVQVIATASEKSWAETSLADSQDTWVPDEGIDLMGKVPLAVVVEVADPAAVSTTTVAAVPAPVEGSAAPVPTPPVAAPAVAIEAAPALPPKAGGRVIVYGDGDFASNKLITVGVNQDLLLNAVAWIVGEEDQVTIRPNEAGKGKLNLNIVTVFLSCVVALVVAPGLTIVGAVATWLRRRRL
ncbi:MAG: Gldg family protein [Pseudomonadota bacterium]|nr:Gldg family protein [Pseudomonadota bacterium]